MIGSILKAGVAAGSHFSPVAASAGRLGLQLGGRAVSRGLQTTAMFGAAAGAMALGVGFGAYRVARHMGGGQVMHMEGWKPQIRPGIQRGLVAGAWAGAAVGGVRAGWGVSHGAGGAPEMERSDFLGATGSMVIGSRARPKVGQTDWADVAYRSGAYTEDLMHFVI